MVKRKVILRADGNAKIGYGHVMRLLALFDCISESFNCLFLLSEKNDAIEKHINKQGCKYEVMPPCKTAKDEVSFMAEKHVAPNDIVVLDGYHFDTTYQKLMKAICNKLVRIDDVPNMHHYADVIVNHAGNVVKSNYSAELYTQFYLGTAYALVRNAFYEKAKNDVFEIDLEKDNNVFISMGGADPTNELFNVLDKIALTNENYNYQILIGGAYQHAALLQTKLKKMRCNYVIHKNLNLEEIVSLMTACKIAIVTPSTIAYEYLHIGGILFLQQTAQNQKNILSYLIKEALALPFNKGFKLPETDTIKTMLQKQKAVFNGEAKLNYLNLFKSLKA